MIAITRARVITAASAIAALSAVAYAVRPDAIVVDTATVERRTVASTIEADGRTRVRQRYTIVAPVAGRVERMTVAEGAAVRAGDVIARLAPLPLDSPTLMQVHARIAAATALALGASGQSRVAAAALEQRRRELSRALRLAEAGGAAPRIVEECQLAATEAEEAARGAAERARAAEAERDQARAALVGRDGGGAILVRAPAHGRVLRVAERSERIVAAGTPLIEIGDPASLEVLIDVLSSDAATIRPGDPVRLAEWRATGDGEAMSPLGGRVREVEPAAFTKVSALGVEEQRVNVIVDVDTVPPAIGDGFRVEASIVVWSAPDVIALPRAALLQAGGGAWSVFVLTGGRVAGRAVRVGHLGGAVVEALDGVAAGDTVVLFPSERIVPGVRAKPRGG